MRHIPDAVIYLTGLTSTVFFVFCGIYFSSNKTIGIWSLYGGLIFGLLTGFLYWQNDLWKTQVQTKQNPETQTYDTKKDSPAKIISSHQTPPKHKKVNKEITKMEEKATAPDSDGLTVGDDSVVMGNVPPGTKVGKGSVVIGPTDNRGNTILNTPMAVGRDARAGPGSIAIGAGAGAGSQQEKAPESEPEK